MESGMHRSGARIELQSISGIGCASIPINQYAMEAFDSIRMEYDAVLSSQKFVEEELDYDILNSHLPFLEQLDAIGNSSVSVFDLHRRDHVFLSSSFSGMLGYDIEEAQQAGLSFFDEKVHPEDLESLLRNGIELLRFCLAIPAEERRAYKLINEYRIRNGSGEYVRVLEQHQVLEQDRRDNVWLSLGIIDISPEPDLNGGIKSRLINFRTGEVFHFPISGLPGKDDVRLSSREQEVLGLVRSGLISKEIADRLSISVHTVNKHRQRILEKLNAGNSMEAVRYASNLGLLE